MFLRLRFSISGPPEIHSLSTTLSSDGPRPAGIFVPDAGGRATVKIAAQATGAPVRVLSVTLEPESGVPAPTGAVVLAPR